MPVITLPDGSQREYPQPLTVADVAASIGAGLAKAALAGRLDGRLVDTGFRIEQDAQLAIVTDKDPAGLEIIRHSTAHLLAYAVKELFPEAQVTIGPVIENGFYYDFAYKRPFTPEDLAAIEKRMLELAKKDFPVSREVLPRDKAVEFFKSQGEHYKAELIAAIPAGEDVSLYHEGDFVDLCRGPHVPSTGKLKHFKLMKVAGAYWRGDPKNEQLQRIYGTAWAKKDELDAYLHMLEEAEKRDHRKLGQQLDLFHFQEEAPGSVFWHPHGWRLFLDLIGYMRARQEDAGYVEVNTPDVMDRALWELSGHWFNYREHMFTTQTEDERVFALKPMNCPGGVALFKQGIKSYRDLPLRMAEFGKVHRYEPSGALHGLLRVRHFTQDDAHIFCTEEQMEDECKSVVALILDIYKDFGFDSVRIKLSTRPEKRIGSDATWDTLEGALSNALDHMGIAYDLFPGEGAFYGPKLEFVLRDAIGRDWQCGTLQVDMNLPERFDIHYVAADNTHKRPVMLHRALFGSLERFTGILIENHAGAMPLWLSPVQVVVMNISEAQTDYAESVAKMLRKAGLRVESDLRGEKINYKIREHSLLKRPYIVVVGDKEKAAGLVAVRARGNQDLGQMSPDALIERLLLERSSKGVAA
ncbi:MAG: threonine--tRNA ligase [Gammaproteobacteria bacterium]|nr:threonine--tRNA ligase [Rhodocyclaceae bacterium]MBU3908328.1 threonine--tRNA ligase [Gammaproteobacteria bacterium]MBU4004038.1 threonine--tRNA ligase [Gammaproteobacteria bacterium]MBU4020285.1 threonine--tRNA ligase [Gammaproteobacteria bacterium]MBU4094633.1 threonine--tRNA ligase [Gammaproteobacteria bacterium]